MFDNEKQTIAEQVRLFCTAQGIPLPEIKWMFIPFRGEWGISTSFFASAVAEAKAGNNKGMPIPARA